MKVKFGFRTGRSCAETLFVARRLLERTRAAKNGSLAFWAVNGAKAFDSITRMAWLLLWRFGIPNSLRHCTLNKQWSQVCGARCWTYVRTKAATFWHIIGMSIIAFPVLNPDDRAPLGRGGKIRNGVETRQPWQPCVLPTVHQSYCKCYSCRETTANACPPS